MWKNVTDFVCFVVFFCVFSANAKNIVWQNLQQQKNFVSSKKMSNKKNAIETKWVCNELTFLFEHTQKNKSFSTVTILTFLLYKLRSKT